MFTSKWQEPLMNVYEDTNSRGSVVAAHLLKAPNVVCMFVNKQAGTRPQVSRHCHFHSHTQTCVCIQALRGKGTRRLDALPDECLCQRVAKSKPIKKIENTRKLHLSEKRMQNEAGLLLHGLVSFKSLSYTPVWQRPPITTSVTRNCFEAFTSTSS